MDEGQDRSKGRPDQTFQKHFYILLGVIIGVIVSIPFLIGAWGVAQEHAKSVVTFSLGILVTIVTLLLIAVLSKDAIF